MSAAMAEIAGGQGCAAIVRPTTDPKFGDYQANGVMALAKQLKTNSRKLAEDVAARLDLGDMCEAPEVAGPGFINLRLKAEYTAARLQQISEDAGELGIERAEEPQTVVVDFSSPNIAKRMHVGHLRSTIIGDCICRVLECLGHKVIRQNHIGDWGTQFGMLMAYLDEESRKRERYAGAPLTAEELKLPLVIFEHFYRQAKLRYDSDEEFQKKSRDAVVLLHKDDPEYTVLWCIIVDESRKDYQEIYDRLPEILTRLGDRIRRVLVE